MFMAFIDAVGQVIEVGSYITYPKTGTIGKAQDLKVENDSSWVKIDKTELWYDCNIVEVIDKTKIKNKKDNTRKDINIDDIKKSNDLGDVELSSGACEGGG